jgi:hypothetical protein
MLQSSILSTWSNLTFLIQISRCGQWQECLSAISSWVCCKPNFLGLAVSCCKPNFRKYT